MPRTRSIAWSELKVGIIARRPLLIVFMIFAVGGEGGFWWERYPLKVKFTEVQGLKAGAVVRLNGKEVGAVTAVNFAGAEIEVDLELLDDVRPLVTTDSVAEIGSLSLLGEPIVDVTASRTGTPLGDGEFIKTSPPSPTIGELSDQAARGLEKLDGLLGDAALAGTLKDRHRRRALTPRCRRSARRPRVTDLDQRRPWNARQPRQRSAAHPEGVAREPGAMTSRINSGQHPGRS
jgi:ABC-type transporter Mla subunit MlaD